MKSVNSLQSLSDNELLRKLLELVAQSRRTEADLVAHIAEVDHRRLYAAKACSSMFSYCTEVLHLSEPEAYLRIGVGRTARRFPAVLAMLEDGRVHLSGIALLAPHLTDENCETLLARAAHRSKEEDRGAHRRAGSEAGRDGGDSETTDSSSPGPRATPSGRS